MSPSTSEVDDASRALQQLVGDSPPPRFFNASSVLAAEKGGMPVLDGLLGRVLQTPPDRERRDRTLQVCSAVADHLIALEVQNKCHNLHSALFLMLDSAAIPSVIVWGSVHVETRTPPGSFALNAELPQWGRAHRPGHSWLVTPDFRVIDLALAHQGDVGGTYAAVKATIPRVVHVADWRSDRIPREWYPDAAGSPIENAAYANATKYFDVLGWSALDADGFTARYLPSAVTAPTEDLDDFDLCIGGLRPDRAFERFVLHLLE